MEKKDNFDELPHIILMVSDNQIDTRKIERKLMDVTTMNTRFFSSTSVKDALGHIVERKLAVDVIILDLRLRGVSDPLQLCRDMVTSAAGIPVMALDSDVDDGREMELAVKAAGAADYLSRNRFDELFIRLNKLIHHR